jgi:hypothetical protein
MMTNGTDSMMGPMMVWVMTYGFVVSILVLVLLTLLAVWLFQQVRRTSNDFTRPNSPPANG